MTAAMQQVNLRMTEAEQATLRRLASDAHQTASEYMRSLVRGAERRASIEHDAAVLERLRRDNPAALAEMDGLSGWQNDADYKELDLG